MIFPLHILFCLPGAAVREDAAAGRALRLPPPEETLDRLPAVVAAKTTGKP